jgi:hypothetical protein
MIGAGFMDSSMTSERLQRTAKAARYGYADGMPRGLMTVLEHA